MPPSILCETTKVLLIDPVPLARLIEHNAKLYLRQNIIEETPIERILTTYDVYGRPHTEISTINVFKSHLPIIGLEIIKSYVEKILISNSAWSKQKNPSLLEIWSSFISSDYEYTPDVYELIESLLIDLSTDIREFIGDNKWIIHLQRNRYSDILIEKCIDYRIHWYKQHFGDEVH